MSLSNVNNSKKLGIYISFKYSEKGLYDKVKLIPNYSTVIKELLREYVENGKDMPQKQNGKSMLITVNDLCKIISSVNPVLRESNVNEKYSNEININQNNKISTIEDDLIPEDMLSGL